MLPRSDLPSADTSGPRVPDANRPAATTLPAEYLNQIFQQELLDHGPAMYVADLEGRILWSNAGFKRMAAAAGGSFLPLADIAGEIALLGSMVFREDLMRLGDSMQRLRSRHVALKEGDGKTGAIAGIILEPVPANAGCPQRGAHTAEPSVRGRVVPDARDRPRRVAQRRDHRRGHADGPRPAGGCGVLVLPRHSDDGCRLRP